MHQILDKLEKTRFEAQAATMEDLFPFLLLPAVVLLALEALIRVLHRAEVPVRLFYDLTSMPYLLVALALRAARRAVRRRARARVDPSRSGDLGASAIPRSSRSSSRSTPRAGAR